MDSLGDRIRMRRQALGLSQADLAEKAGISQQAVAKIEQGQTRRPGSIVEIAHALAASPEWLQNGGPLPGGQPAGGPRSERRKAADGDGVVVAPEIRIPAMETLPRDLPVYGAAEAGDSGLFEFNGEIVDYVRRPPGLIGVRNAFAIFVSGDSMVPVYRDGDPVAVHPGKPVRPGDDCVVEFYPDAAGASGRAFIKRMVAKTSTSLVVEQFNPPARLEFGADEIKRIYRAYPWPSDWAG